MTYLQVDPHSNLKPHHSVGRCPAHDADRGTSRDENPVERQSRPSLSCNNCDLLARLGLRLAH